VATKEMAANEFRHIVETYIRQFLHDGADLRLIGTPSDKRISVNKHIIVENGTIKIYPCKNAPPFYLTTPTSVSSIPRVAEELIRELLLVSNYSYNKPGLPSIGYAERVMYGEFAYSNARFDVAYEIAICQWLGSATLFRLLDKMKAWAQKTYEGRRMPFSFVIDSGSSASGAEDFIRFLESNHSAVFTDGMTSGVALDKKGCIVKYFSTHDHQNIIENGKIPLVPQRFYDFAQMCTADASGNWLGVVSQSNGDIVIIKDKRLVFVRRNGKWAYIDAYHVYTAIKNALVDVDEETRETHAKEIYSSILDVSFSKTGGCIAIYNNASSQDVHSIIGVHDNLLCVEESTEKKKIISRLINGETFVSLDRKLRQELLSLDGATIIDASGKIVGVGAIIAVPSGSEEGGRTAATKILALYGLSIKISTFLLFI